MPRWWKKKPHKVQQCTKGNKSVNQQRTASKARNVHKGKIRSDGVVKKK